MTQTARIMLYDENDAPVIAWQPNATENIPGVIKVDGTTITSNNGIITASGFANTDLSNLTAAGNAKFTGKMDVDMSNMNAGASAKKTVVSWVMPNYSAGVAKTAGTMYTANSNCFVQAFVESSNETLSAGIQVYKPDGTTRVLWVCDMSPSSSDSVATAQTFIPKGYKYIVNFVGSVYRSITEYPLIGG